MRRRPSADARLGFSRLLQRLLNRLPGPCRAYQVVLFAAAMCPVDVGGVHVPATWPALRPTCGFPPSIALRI